MKRILCVLLLMALSAVAQAHKPSDSYLVIKAESGRIEGQWDIALRDLEYAIGLDADGNGEITWGELSARHKELASYALARLQVSSGDAACVMQATDHLVDTHSDGAYAVIRFGGDCAATGALKIRYGLFFELDPTHRGLTRIEAGGVTQTAVFGPERAEQVFNLAKPSLLEQIVAYVLEGVWHIWIGFDHVLFLLSLLLPAVWQRAGGRWSPAPRFAPVFWEVLKVVTAFTVAHSITLSLAALELIALPSRLVESVIAASVVLAALNNLFPLVSGRRWAMAFGFGLIHGFGFASVLTDLGLPRDALVTSLFGFNVGVELGQLAIVAVFLPLAFALRSTKFYSRIVFTGGSITVALLAAVWLAERALDIELLP